MNAFQTTLAEHLPAAMASKRAVVDPAALNAAFEALKTYAAGSGRAALLPIDEAVAAGSSDRTQMADLEPRLIAALQGGGSPAAREFVASKLVMIGSAASVPALAALLSDERVATMARTALEAIPGPQSAKALRESLPKLAGVQKVGAINSLGVRRDTGSVQVLTTLLKDLDERVVVAAAAALGNVGSSKAAKALVAFLPKAAAPIRVQVADACLVCADHLIADGRKSDAQALYRRLASSTQPKHVQLAIERGLVASDAK